ncbi:MAG: MCE family protein, partial [Alphaproteobacteria bacterium]|nr:MCE family protein [Alphaproteobacteria bacterium]
MESKSSNVLVGAVTIGLAVALFAFVLWLSNSTGAERKQFDILFKQSVSGLAVGSQVQFAGVPAGAVEE